MYTTDLHLRISPVLVDTIILGGVVGTKWFQLMAANPDWMLPVQTLEKTIAVREYLGICDSGCKSSYQKGVEHQIVVWLIDGLLGFSSA